MLTREEVLLFVSAVYFVMVRATITKMLEPSISIIKIFDVCSTIHQTLMYGLLKSVLGAKRG